jgi:hypothetical protein
VGPNCLAAPIESTTEVLLPSEVGLPYVKPGEDADRAAEASPFGTERSLGAESHSLASPTSSPWGSPPTRKQRARWHHAFDSFEPVPEQTEWDDLDAALLQETSLRWQAMALQSDEEDTRATPATGCQATVALPSQICGPPNPEPPPEQKAWRPRKRRPRVLTASQRRAAKNAGTSEERINWFLRKSSSERKRLHKKRLWL